MKERRHFGVWCYWTLLGSAAAFILLYQALSFVRNLPPVARGSVVVFIKPDSTVKEIARRLGQAGVLDSPWKFRLLAKVWRKEAKLKPGEYRFQVPSPPLAALRTLLEGKVILHKVTFPEGSNMWEVGRILAAARLVNLDDFEALLHRKDLLGYLGLPGESFEGFLFPETYNFSRLDRPDRMIETMVARFQKAILPEDRENARKLGLDLLQWVTLASIIEKESGLTAEHAIISSVFHNRLRKRMRLQSDPTVIYGIRDFDGNLTKRDLETPTAYNTYRKAGLPPGPIANPGSSAIRAAANPAATDFLYFVADGKGAHVFAETYEEHARNVVRYQLKGAPSAPVPPGRTPKPKPPPR